MYHTDDTIAAIASAAGGAARGIVRLSGPRVVEILEACFYPHAHARLPSLRMATVVPGTIKLATSPPIELPADLHLWPSDRSYTRQKAAEIHAIGSPPLIAAVLRTVCEAGARLAEQGEFTLRAFLAGRIDLTQAEAVLGIIDARGEHELKGALEQLAGGLARPLSELRLSLVELLAEIEAGLDFTEEDLQFVTPQQIQRQLDNALSLVARLNAQLHDRGHHDELPRAALVGWPNVGKSSLFNVLSQGAALVTNEPGTTRDYLTATLDLNGVGCRLIDTAGVEPGGVDNSIAGVAQQLAASQAQSCDVRLLCLDASRPLNDWERRELAANHDGPRLVVVTKCDAVEQRDAGLIELPNDAVPTSALHATGLDRLRHSLRHAVESLPRSDAAAGMTAHRCAESLRSASEALTRASELNQQDAGEELIGCELRLALDELGKVAGTVYTDDILDRIFSRFCIGK